jgi:hypothetical protein
MKMRLFQNERDESEITNAKSLNYVAQACLKFKIFLPPPPKFWDYRYRPPLLLCAWDIF